MNDRINRYGLCRVDKAEQLVDKIIEDFTDRRGLRQAWDDIDADVREDIKNSWLDIVLEWEDV